MSVFSIPFRFDPAVGRPAQTVDGTEVWRSRIRSVLLTPLGARVMRPNFGTDLNTLLFEPEATAVEIGEKMIVTAFNTWLTKLSLIEVSPKYDRYTGTLTFDITYNLPTGEQDQLTVTTAVFDTTGTKIQEVPRG